MRIENNMAAWKAVVEVARCASMRDAAIALDMDVSMVSRLISALEDRLNAKFFDRAARPMRLTAYGEEHLPAIRALVEQQGELWANLSRARSAGRRAIRLGVVAGYPREQLLAMLAEYKQASPEVDIEVVTEVDHQDLLRERVDVAYLLYMPDDPNLCVRFVHCLGVLPVASRTYVRKHGSPRRPEDLARHTLLLRTARNYPESTCLVRGLARRPFAAAHVLSGDFLTIRSALLAGLGVALDLPTASIQDGLARGEIVPVLDGWSREPFRVSLAARRSEAGDPTIERFMCWFVKRERQAALERYRAVGLPFEQRSGGLFWTMPSSDGAAG